MLLWCEGGLNGCFTLDPKIGLYERGAGLEYDFGQDFEKFADARTIQQAVKEAKRG